MTEWTQCFLGDVLKLQRGHDLPDRLRRDGPVPVVSSSGITGWHNEAKAKAPGVVTGRYGTLGEVYFIEDDYWPLNTSLYVVDFKGNQPRFISYFLRSVLKNYKSDKAAVPGIDRNVAHCLPVKRPDPDTQRRIVSILSAYDDLIENNRRRIALLEQAAREIYREWFVRLRFPGHEHVKVVDGVPEGWLKMSLTKAADNVDYGYTASASSDNIGPRFLRITDIVGGPINWGSVPFCEMPDRKLARFLLDPADIVVARTGATTGWARRIGRMNEKSVFASYLVRFRFGERIRPLLASVYMESELYKAQIAARLGGAAQPNASAVVLGAPEILIPTHQIQHDFMEVAEPITEQVDILVNQSETLAKARDLLLPKLMNGEVAA